MSLFNMTIAALRAHVAQLERESDEAWQYASSVSAEVFRNRNNTTYDIGDVMYADGVARDAVSKHRFADAVLRAREADKPLAVPIFAIPVRHPKGA